MNRLFLSVLVFFNCSFYTFAAPLPKEIILDTSLVEIYSKERNRQRQIILKMVWKNNSHKVIAIYPNPTHYEYHKTEKGFYPLLEIYLYRNESKVGKLGCYSDPVEEIVGMSDDTQRKVFLKPQSQYVSYTRFSTCVSSVVKGLSINRKNTVRIFVHNQKKFSVISTPLRIDEYIMNKMLWEFENNPFYSKNLD